MFSKKITYTDFDDVERTETFYFGILESEITQKALQTRGDLVNKIQRAIDAKDMPELVLIMTEFIDMSYGVKSDDGRFFRKSKEALEDFKSTQAYNKLYMELVTDTKAAIEFVNRIFPKDLVAKAQENPEFKNKMDELERNSQ